MCRVGRLLWERGLVGATEGNISARLAKDALLCTPGGLSKGHLSPNDLVVINLAGKALDDGTPSSEIGLHVRAFARRPDCQAVVHAHPPIATGLALAGRTIPDTLLPEAMIVLGRVPLLPFAMPGTDAVPDGLEPFLADHKTFLLGHHGAATLGRDLADAYHRMETLERVAAVLLHAEAMGGPQPLPPAAAAELKAHLHGRL